jgi:pimeloyl-ACP methyl ester carboxylesterase
VADFAADAVALLEQFVPAPAVLIGHSLGALVAALVAAKLHEHVRALVLEDPPGTTLAQDIRRSPFHLQFTNTERLLATARDAEGLTRELAGMQVQRPGDGALVRFSEIRDLATIRFGAECLLQMDPAVLRTLLEGRWLEGLDWFGSLRQIECPTLLLRADPACGGMLDQGEAERIASSIHRCARVDLPGVAHSIHSTQPDRMLELMTNFLKANELPSPRITP